MSAVQVAMRWEYKTVQVVLGAHAREQTIDQTLRRYGGEGWEVVSAFDANAGDSTVHHVFFVMKRPEAI